MSLYTVKFGNRIGSVSIITPRKHGFMDICDPVAELDRVQRHSQSENFKQFIAKLKETVEDLSIQEAFADLEADRSHIMNERSAYIRDSIDRKRAAMGQLALRPMLLAIYGMLVFPLMYTGITQMSSMTEKVREL